MESPLASSNPAITASVPTATKGVRLSPVKAMAKKAAKGTWVEMNSDTREAPMALMLA